MHVVDLFSHEKNREIGVPNSHKLKTILQIPHFHIVTHLLMGTIVHKSQYTLYFEIFLKTLGTLYQGTEGVQIYSILRI